MLGSIRRFDTSNLGDTTSVDLWREYLNDVFYDHGVRATPEMPLRGTLRHRDVADVGVLHHSATAHAIFRDKALIEKDKTERHSFVFPLAGTFACLQNGRQATFDAGQMYVLNASEPFDVTTSDGASSFAFCLPSDLARRLRPGLDDLSAHEGVGDPFLISTIHGLCGGVLRHRSPIDAVWLRNITIELLGAALHPRHSIDARGAWRSSDAARLWVMDACRRCIRERLQDKRFGVADAAAACGVSVRYLQTILKSAGSTFGRELLHARLERAALLLRSTSRGRKSVGEIASDCGFGSQAHFATRYREHFGLTPRDETPSIETQADGRSAHLREPK